MYFQKKVFHQIDVIIAYFQTGGVSSHPYKMYMEFKEVSLRLCKGNVSDGRYQEIRDHYRNSRFQPIYSFLLSKFRSGLGQKVRKRLEKQEFILYGAGKFGKKFFNAMRELGLDVIAIWDSNTARHGSTMDGVPIQTPCPKNQRQDSAIILLATVKYNDAITVNLQSLGYEIKKDFLTREAWLGWVAKAWMGGK